MDLGLIYPMKWLIFFGLIVVGIGVILVKKSKNNVCRTFEDYYTNVDSNENCYFNPDAGLPVPEIIKRWGYPVEIHNATTEDGYILSVFRIPYGKKSTTKKPGPPIFLQHGYKSNSKCFATTGNKSLSFILADAGYDVWMGNFRGSIYSRHHESLSENDERYWDYTFHEHGVYDVPSQIALVKKITKQKVIYIGYSMGGTAGTIYSVTYPEVAKRNVKIFILLAPFIYADGISSFAQFGMTIWPIITPITQFLTNGQYYPNGFRDLNEKIWRYVCYPYPIQMRICQIFDMWAAGFDYEQNDPETLPVTLLHLSETSSVKLVNHLSQVMLTGEFRQFDYSLEENLKLYGSPKPPIYNISEMKVPIYILRSDNDMTCTKESIEKFYESVPKTVKPYKTFVVNNTNFNHVDFVFARDVVTLLYDHLLLFINNL